MCGDFISMACPVRTGRLRALAARIGYAVRTSRLSDSDGIRFMSPLADVLLDLRDELAHVRRRWPVSSAPVGVKLQLDLLQVLAQRVPHHSSATMSTLPSPVIIKLEDHVSMSSTFTVYVAICYVTAFVYGQCFGCFHRFLHHIP